MTRSTLFTSSLILGAVACSSVGEPSPPIEGARSFGLESMCGGDLVVDDVALTSDATDINDLEVDYDNDRIALLANPGAKIVVAAVDATTGNLTQRVVVDGTGKATLRCGEIGIGNGPEWARSQRGSELYFNYVTNGTAAIARATERTDGSWSVNVLPGSEGRSCALASYHRADAAPWLMYAAPGPMAAHAPVIAGAVESPIPEVALTRATGASPARIVPGRREVVFAQDAGGQLQVARKELDTGRVDIVSAYALGAVEIRSVSVVAAPKYGPDAYFFYANVIGSGFESGRLDVFLSRGWGQNEKISELRPPVTSANVVLTDDENFVRNGESYVTIVMASAATNPPSAGQTSEIWIAHAEASEPCHYRRISGDAPARRSDPEPMSLATGTFVYYREVAPNGNGVLHRAATGIP